MAMNTRLPVSIVVLGFVPALLLFGCAKRVSTTPPPSLAGTERVLLMPFVDVGTRNPVGGAVRSPLTGKVFEAGPVHSDAPAILGNHLIDRLRSQTRFELVGTLVAGRMGTDLMAMRESGVPEIQVLTAAGRATDAELVMAGYVYAFRERQGGSYAVETPAAVGFELQLVSVAGERVVWSGYFAETQQSLSENLLKLGLFVDRGARWVTASEMALPAIDEMVDELGGP
jgi:hypothetical protein